MDLSIYDFTNFLIHEMGRDVANVVTYSHELGYWISDVLAAEELEKINFGWKAWAKRDEKVVNYAEFIQEKLNQPILSFEEGRFMVRKLTGMREFNGQMVYTTNFTAMEYEKSLNNDERGKLKRINF